MRNPFVTFVRARRVLIASNNPWETSESTPIADSFFSLAVTHLVPGTTSHLKDSHLMALEEWNPNPDDILLVTGAGEWVRTVFSYLEGQKTSVPAIAVLLAPLSPENPASPLPIDWYWAATGQDLQQLVQHFRSAAPSHVEPYPWCSHMSSWRSNSLSHPLTYKTR